MTTTKKLKIKKMGRREKHTYIQMFIAALLIITLLVPADPGEGPGTENLLP